MLAVTVTLLALLTLVTWRAGRTMLFPPALFAGAWTGTLFCILLAGRTFLPISEYACLIYLTGAVAFALGGLIVLFACPENRAPFLAGSRSSPGARIALDMLLVALIALFPYYLKVALEIAGTPNIMQAVVLIRRRTVEASDINLFGWAGNLNLLASLVATAALYESDGTWQRRIRSVLAVVLALAYSALTGSKSGALFLVTLFFVTQVKARKIKAATALIGLAIALAFFGGGVFVINLGGQNVKSLGETANEVASEVGSYWLGSPIAFSSIAEKPDSLVSSLSIDRFPLEIGNKIGIAAAPPSVNNAKYISISGSGESTNAYTIYFSYFKDYGWSGMTLLLAALAAILTVLWRRAMAGEPVAILMYATLCTAIVQSIEAEQFFVGLEGYLKAFAVFWLLYRFVPCFVEPLWLVVACRA